MGKLDVANHSEINIQWGPFYIQDYVQYLHAQNYKKRYNI